MVQINTRDVEWEYQRKRFLKTGQNRELANTLTGDTNKIIKWFSITFYTKTTFVETKTTINSKIKSTPQIKNELCFVESYMTKFVYRTSVCSQLLELSVSVHKIRYNSTPLFLG